MSKRVFAVVAIVPISIATVAALSERAPLRAETPASVATTTTDAAVTESPASVESTPPADKHEEPATLAGLDLTKIHLDSEGATAPLLEGRVAKLTVVPSLQKAATDAMAKHHLKEGAVVVMDVATGKLLAYASHVERGQRRDLAVIASAPAASVFKIVTGAALVEHAGAKPSQEECYSGGEHKIFARDLVPDKKRDATCTTLAGAMGHSINTVFARLASQRLRPSTLLETAHQLGFGKPLSFDVPVVASQIQLPDDSLGFARTAAGFWNTTLSPLHGAWMGAVIARQGEPVRPTLVTDIMEGDRTLKHMPSPPAQARVIKPETARAVSEMMQNTVSEGTGHRAFYDRHGRPFLPGVSVVGKTGTLTDPEKHALYTWFVGYAEPAHEPGRDKQANAVSFGVLAVNGETWTAKANVLAREVLEHYFSRDERRNEPRQRVGGGEGASTTRATKHRRQRGS